MPQQGATLVRWSTPALEELLCMAERGTSLAVEITIRPVT